MITGKEGEDTSKEKYTEIEEKKIKKDGRIVRMLGK